MLELCVCAEFFKMEERFWKPRFSPRRFSPRLFSPPRLALACGEFYPSEPFNGERLLTV